jgi:hypothetical protein
MGIVREKKKKKTPTPQKNLDGKNSPKKNKRKLNEFPRRRAKGEKKIWIRGAVLVPVDPESVKQ